MTAILLKAVKKIKVTFSAVRVLESHLGVFLIDEAVVLKFQPKAVSIFYPEQYYSDAT